MLKILKVGVGVIDGVGDVSDVEGISIVVFDD